MLTRRAVPGDASGFVSAHEVAWDASIAPLVGKRLAELASFDDRVARCRAGIDRPPSSTGVWVAERNGEIVGLAVRSASELRDLYVIPRAWGTGVSQALMTAALDDMRVEGQSEALLWVGEQNARARRFYEREGWLVTGRTRDSVFGLREVQYGLALVDFTETEPRMRG